MPDEFYKKSVTKDELGEVRNGTVFNVMVPLYGLIDTATQPLPQKLPAYWCQDRDKILRKTIHYEAMWAAAVSIAITKAASSSFEAQGENIENNKFLHELLMGADGRRAGWSGFIPKHLRDYLTTDNGAFVEIIRASSAVDSKIIGLKHLDSMRCIRTGDPEIPVLYWDKMGRWHELKDYQIMMFNELPDPSETLNGVGVCAASRAYSAIYRLYAMETYLTEKISGSNPLAIYIVNGLLEGQLEGALRANEDNNKTRGVRAYRGAVIVGIPSGIQPELVTIPLAELPDRFNRKEEFDIAILSYADNLGLDVQDLQPLSGQGFGTGSQSQVLAEKSRGRGLALWKQDFVHNVNEYIAPDDTSMVFIEKDYRDMQQAEMVSKARVDVASSRITAKITTPEQEFALMIKNDELPKDLKYEVQEEPEPGMEEPGQDGIENPAGAPGKPKPKKKPEKQAPNPDETISSEEKPKTKVRGKEAPDKVVLMMPDYRDESMLQMARDLITAVEKDKTIWLDKLTKRV